MNTNTMELNPEKLERGNSGYIFFKDVHDYEIIDDHTRATLIRRINNLSEARVAAEALGKSTECIESREALDRLRKTGSLK